MSLRIEWRSRAEGDDALLAVEDGANAVVHVWQVEPALLADFLNNMDDLETGDGDGIGPTQLDPAGWGDLVIARSEDGDVLSVDPERYWGGITQWFRSRGQDPHTWHSNH